MEITIQDGLDDESEDMISCAQNIITTVRGTMPYMRDMGISDDIISLNTSQSEDKFVVSATEQVEEWDERLRVSNIRMDPKEGIIEPKVVLTSDRD